MVFNASSAAIEISFFSSGQMTSGDLPLVRHSQMDNFKISIMIGDVES